MRRTLCPIAVLATILLPGCDGYNDATTPSPTPTTTLPISVLVQGTVVGEAGEPVAAARLRLLGGGGIIAASATTNENGGFQLAGVVPQLPPGGLAEVETSREGFDPTRVPVDIRTARQVTLRLLRPPVLRAGQPVETRLFTDGSRCGVEYEFLCRRIVLDADATDTFEVEIAPVDTDGSVGLVLGSASYPFAFERRIVASGGEIWIYGLQPLGVRVSARPRQ